MCIIDCLSTIVFILPLHLDYTKVIILILWWRNFQLEYWRTFQLVSTNIAYSEWDDYRKQNGQDECIGNPQSRGIPTWFVLPDDMMFSEKFSGAMQRLDELRKGK